MKTITSLRCTTTTPYRTRYRMHQQPQQHVRMKSDTHKMREPNFISMLEQFVSDYQLLLNKSIGPHDPLLKEINQKKALVELTKQYLSSVTELQSLKDVLLDENEEFFVEMAKQEIQEKEEHVSDIEDYLIDSFVPEDDAGDAIVEIKPGAGGLEASLFAMDVLNMYRNYATNNSWSFKLVDLQETDVGGIRGATFHINGDNSYSKLKYESGVHRVQRIPKTESQGRVHTSTITVIVLKDYDEEDIVIDIPPKDLRIDVYRSGGAGGQHVNTTDSAVRLTHLPTGFTVAIQNERSQHRNKSTAMKILKAKLWDLEKSKQVEQRNSIKSSLVGTGDRNERIRTYNFAQDRITDHRINFSMHGIESMLGGLMLDSFHNELYRHSLKERIEILEEDFPHFKID